MRALRSAALLAAIVALSAGPSAQGLADAARRASAPPQQPATKKYTNDDVETAKPVAPPAPVAVAAPAEVPKSETAKAADSAAPAAAEAVKATDPEPKKTPEHVLNRIAQLKARLPYMEKQLLDMQARDAASDAALVTKQIAAMQIELKALEARVNSKN